ncbi:unknown [Clostridium sp. CAG:217]|nr:unknown [Clostridium sp. CAG:217]
MNPLKANEMPHQEPLVRNKNFLEVATGYDAQTATAAPHGYGGLFFDRSSHRLRRNPSVAQRQRGRAPVRWWVCRRQTRKD